MKNFFEEKQSFKSAWIIIFFSLINLPFIYGIYKQVILSEPWGTKPGPTWLLVLIACFMFFFTIWFSSVKLIVKVDMKGINIRFFLLKFKPIKIPFEDISTIKIRKYNAIKEHMGWGIKGTRFNRAYTVSGNMGIQLVLKNEKRILIGSKKVNSFLSTVQGFMSDEKK